MSWPGEKQRHSMSKRGIRTKQRSGINVAERERLFKRYWLANPKIQEQGDLQEVLEIYDYDIYNFLDDNPMIVDMIPRAKTVEDAEKFILNVFGTLEDYLESEPWLVDVIHAVYYPEAREVEDKYEAKPATWGQQTDISSEIPGGIEMADREAENVYGKPYYQLTAQERGFIHKHLRQMGAGGRAKKMTKQDIKCSIMADTLVKHKDGSYTARWGFFYTYGRDEDTYVAKLKEKFPDVEIIEKGEIWKPFKGGAPVSRQSHWYIKFRFGEG